MTPGIGIVPRADLARLVEARGDPSWSSKSKYPIPISTRTPRWQSLKTRIYTRPSANAGPNAIITQINNQLAQLKGVRVNRPVNELRPLVHVELHDAETQWYSFK